MNIAILSSENIVENILVVDSVDDVNGYEPQRLLDVTNLMVSVGQRYSEQHEKFVPLNFRENFIFDETSWKWIPQIHRPEDATWVPELDGAEPESHKELEAKKVYFWADKYQQWGLVPTKSNPRPSEEHFWNAIEKEWQLPDSEKPGENYIWDAIEHKWIDVSEFTNPE
jgi:hypothetical protein